MLTISGNIPPPHAFHTATTEVSIFISTAGDPATRRILELPALLKGSEGAQWNTANINKIRQITQSVGQRIPTGSNTRLFIPHHKTPSNKKAT